MTARGPLLPERFALLHRELERRARIARIRGLAFNSGLFLAGFMLGVLGASSLWGAVL